MEPLHPELLRRLNALRVLLVLTLPGAGLLTLLNVRLGAPALAFAAGLLLLVAVVLLTKLKHAAEPQQFALAYLIALVCAIAPVVARPDIHSGAASWVAVIPVLPYLLLPVSRALPSAIVCFMLICMAYFWGAQVAPWRLNPLLLGHVLIPAVGLLTTCHFYARSRHRSEKRLLQTALTDSLTGLGNRTRVLSQFAIERKRAQRTGLPLSMILIDLDNFKQLNDRYGHQSGDDALAFVAHLLESRLRETDLACRIGGEEFVVLLPGTGMAGAITAAEGLRAALEAAPFRGQGEIVELTLSAGVVELGQDGGDWPQLYRAADARLYACKQQGRNRVLGNVAAMSS